MPARGFEKNIAPNPTAGRSRQAWRPRQNMASPLPAPRPPGRLSRRVTRDSLPARSSTPARASSTEPLAASQQPTAVVFGCADSPGGRRDHLRPGSWRHGRRAHRRTRHRFGGPRVHRIRRGGTQRAADRGPWARQLRRGEGHADRVGRRRRATGYIRDVVERVESSILLGRRNGLTEVGEFVTRHVNETAAQLISRSSAIAERVAYQLADGPDRAARPLERCRRQLICRHCLSIGR